MIQTLHSNECKYISEIVMLNLTQLNVKLRSQKIVNDLDIFYDKNLIIKMGKMSSFQKPKTHLKNNIK